MRSHASSFVAAVAYAAALLQPLPVGSTRQHRFRLALAGARGRSSNGASARRRHSRCSARSSACIIGLAIARAIEAGLFWADSADQRVEFLHSFLLIVLPYLGLVLGAKQRRVARAGAADRVCSAPPGRERRYKILDTSVIIDGRIADVCETGFVDGTLVIPQFVLKELQLVADSGDSMKRNRGRRGLDILQKIQKMAGVEVIDLGRRLPRGPRGRL